MSLQCRGSIIKIFSLRKNYIKDVHASTHPVITLNIHFGPLGSRGGAWGVKVLTQNPQEGVGGFFFHNGSILFSSKCLILVHFRGFGWSRTTTVVLQDHKRIKEKKSCGFYEKFNIVFHLDSYQSFVKSHPLWTQPQFCHFPLIFSLGGSVNVTRELTDGKLFWLKFFFSLLISLPAVSPPGLFLSK